MAHAAGRSCKGARFTVTATVVETTVTFTDLDVTPEAGEGTAAEAEPRVAQLTALMTALLGAIPSQGIGSTARPTS